MGLVGLIAGAIAFLFVEVVCHNATGNAHSGDMPGLVAAIWAAWPFFHKGAVQRLNFLHPPAKAYDKSSADVFEQLHEMLRETVYRFGDRWHVITADTQAKRLVADLQYTDEEFNIVAAATGKHSTERMRRLLRMSVSFKEDSGKAVVQFDFEPRGEGSDGDYACDPLIDEVEKAFEDRVGKGTTVSEGFPVKLPAPPWWLVGATGYALVCFAGDVLKSMSGQS